MDCLQAQIQTRSGLLLLILASLPGCLNDGRSPDFTEVAPKDTRETNAVRARIGIRTIKEKWVFRYRESGSEVWFDGQGQLCKKVDRDKSEQIAGECDEYYSGKTFIPVDPDASGIMPEFLYISYNHRLKRFFLGYDGINPATLKLIKSLPLEPLDPINPHGVYTHGSAYQGATNEMTLKVADQILSNWGVSRLK